MEDGEKGNNNNKAFKSQTSWGRLELKTNRSNQGSGMWIAVFQALLSKAKSLGIFHPFKSPFIVSTQVNFGLPLPLFTLLSWLRIPLRTSDSGGLRWTCPNHLNRCWIRFSVLCKARNSKNLNYGNLVILYPLHVSVLEKKHVEIVLFLWRHSK